MTQENGTWQQGGRQPEGQVAPDAAGQGWQQGFATQPPAGQPGSQQGSWAPPQGSVPQGQYAVPPAYAWAPQPAPAPVAAQPSPKRHGWIVAIVVVVALFGLMAIGMMSCTSMMQASMGSLGGLYGTAGESDLDYLSEDAVGVIALDGAIQYDGTTCSPEGLKEALDAAEENPYVKAVVLRVNSGGGSATAGEEMTSYLADFSKPVVVSSAATNASAAYEISSQADYIFTAKTTMIGAIGTAMQFTNLEGLYDLLGIDNETIASAESKDSSYGNRPLTEEERAYYQRQVDAVNETFIKSVADGRAMTEDEVRALATGLTFTGMEAVENGLADEIGTFEDACAKAAELAGMREWTTVSLESDDYYGLYDLLGMESGDASLEPGAQLKKEL